MDERTGTADRPRPRSRAKRMPVVAGAEKPAEARGADQRRALFGVAPVAHGDQVGRVPVGEQEGQGQQDHEERGGAYAEDRPVEGHPVVGLDLADRPQRGEGREGHGDGGGEEGPEQHRPTQTDHAVEDGVGGIGAQ